MKKFVQMAWVISFISLTAAAQLPQGLEAELGQGTVVIDSERGDFLAIQILRDEERTVVGHSAQLYDSEGSSLGEAFELPDLPKCGYSIWGGGLTDTELFLFWPESVPGEEDIDLCSEPPALSNLMGRRYSRGGQPLAAAFQLNTSAIGNQILPGFAVLPDGGFIVTWSDWTAELNDGGDYISHQLVRRFDSDGSPREPTIRVPALPMADPLFHGAVLALENGGFTVAWSYLDAAGDFETSFRSYDAEGQPVVDQIRFGNPSLSIFLDSDIARLEDGTVAVVASGGGVSVRLLSDSGLPLGEPIQVQPILFDSSNAYRRNAHILAGDSGRFLVAWDSRVGPDGEDPSDGDLEGIWAQWIRPGSEPEEEFFQLNSRFRGGQRLVELTGSSGSEPLAIYSSGQGLLARRLRTACTPGPATLCLGEEGRFRVEVAWADFGERDGQAGGEMLNGESGYFWFFRPGNVELMVKVVDGGEVNGNFWVFYGALSNVEYQLTVTDTARGVQKVYRNPAHHFASVGDTMAFANPPSSSPPGEAPETTYGLDPTAVAALLPEVPEFSTIESPASVGASLAGEPLEFAGGRFSASLEWQDFSGNAGPGNGVPLTDDTGYFWFFDSDRPEVVVKVLDGRSINGSFWVFYGALSNVEYTLNVEDRQQSTTRTYFNPSRHFGSVGDTGAFPE
ncbi:MAG: hypothetical protein K0U98_12435 [Deltaproteobacteria bacterium]|nr:hypothetical protein [Deltaproteobacteria bacterium]